MNLDGKEILITGGTGTLGKELVNKLLHAYTPKGIRIFSRDEYKQWVMKEELKTRFPDNKVPVSFLIGDIRDRKRVERATERVDVIIHTAAMKQVPACEQHPIEAIKTNVLGAVNILEAAIENKVGAIMNVSTDKAVYPVNLYGMSKGAAEKLLINGNEYSGGRTLVSCCRYGNVLNSRGSIIPLFKEQYRTNKKITITHKNMTRFFITIQDVVNFILMNIRHMDGGEIFIPKMKSAFILEIAQLFANDDEIIDIGIRRGEKLHECLITVEEGKQMEERTGMWVLYPLDSSRYNSSKEWSYTSERNDQWWHADSLKEHCYV